MSRKIIEVSLEDLLELNKNENLVGKKYALRKDDVDDWKVALVYKARKNNASYVGGKEFEKIIFASFDDEIYVDKDGHPCYLESYEKGEETFRMYEYIFLGNTSYACRLYRYNERLISRVLKLIKKEKKYKWILEKFDAYCNRIIKLLPEIKEEKLKEKYFGRRRPPKFSHRDLKAYDYIMVKKVAYSRKGLYENEYLDDFPKINLSRRQQLTGEKESVKEALLHLWYTEFINSPKYKEKIRLSAQKDKEYFRKHIKLTTGLLEKAGFKKSKNLSED